MVEATFQGDLEGASTITLSKRIQTDRFIDPILMPALNAAASVHSSLFHDLTSNFGSCFHLTNLCYIGWPSSPRNFFTTEFKLLLSRLCPRFQLRLVNLCCGHRQRIKTYHVRHFRTSSSRFKCVNKQPISLCDIPRTCRVRMFFSFRSITRCFGTETGVPLLVKQ